MRITESQLRKIIREEIEDLQEIKWPSFAKSQKIDPQIATMKDLRALIKQVNSDKRTEKGVEGLKDVGMGLLADLIPGGGTALTMIQTLKGMYSAPDEKKTNTKLDLLNIDDEISKIVDDTVEDNFLEKAAEQIQDLPDDAPVPNMTQILSNYLKKNYDSRTVAGFTEGRSRQFSSVEASQRGNGLPKAGSSSNREIIGVTRSNLSEGMRYHIGNRLGVDDNVYRPGTPEFFSLFNEARRLYRAGLYEATDAEAEILDSDLGRFGIYEGERVPLDFPMWDEGVNEAKFKGREVTLGAKGAKRSGGRSHVYVRDPKSGKVKKISFGSGMPDPMGDSEAHKKRRKSFAARHGCAKNKDRMSASYWACRSTKMFGRNVPGYW